MVNLNNHHRTNSTHTHIHTPVLHDLVAIVELRNTSVLPYSINISTVYACRNGLNGYTLCPTRCCGQIFRYLNSHKWHFINFILLNLCLALFSCAVGESNMSAQYMSYNQWQCYQNCMERLFLNLFDSNFTKGIRQWTLFKKMKLLWKILNQKTYIA